MFEEQLKKTNIEKFLNSELLLSCYRLKTSSQKVQYTGHLKQTKTGVRQWGLLPATIFNIKIDLFMNNYVCEHVRSVNIDRNIITSSRYW